ncbi:MAG TPA: phosphate ABC transporter permease PstA [Ilumatobacteraceae bacterium]|nr:phosphate ABC transporter permease PstA [Ilumatobacteraceae bacterium]
MSDLLDQSSTTTSTTVASTTVVSPTTPTTDELWAVTTEMELGSELTPPADELWAPTTPSGRPPTPTTTLPPRPGPGSPVPVRRPIGKVSRNDLLTLFGAVLSSVSITLLLFGQFTPLSGRLGFVVVSFGIFLAIYGLLVSVVDNRPAVVDRVMASLLTAAAVLAGGALVSVIVYILWRGRNALVKINLYTEDMSFAGPLDPLDVGGISHAIVGTLIIIGLSLLFTVPLALACAVYLTETRGPVTEFVRSVVTAMTALPSIVAGLFIFATWVLILGQQRSGLAAAFAVSIMMLPIIIRSADVVLRLVPGNLREASAALGAPQYRTVWFVVLPTARSGLATSVILGVARGIGETAPVLLVSGVTGTMNTNFRENPMMSLPLATFEFVRSPQPALIARGFATAAVLMLVVLFLFVIARILGGRQAGQLSDRQRRRAAQKSLKDLERIEGAVALDVSSDTSAAAPPGPSSTTPATGTSP